MWRTDGTRGGAARVPDVALSYSPFWYRFVGALEQGVYFIAPNGGAWLWRADRTGAKPVKRVSVSWGSPGSYVSAWASLDDRLIFTIDSFGPHRFWVSNGTEAGTLPLFSEPYSERRVVGGRLVRFGAHLYFAARDSEHGVALWRTDGTPEGTELFHDVTPGFDELPLGDIVVHNDALYFVATSRASGAEIWQTDGLNVEQVTELMPGTLSADPQKLQSVQGKLVFAADDGVHGVEPWVLNAK